MPEIELQTDLELSSSQQKILDLHSVLNVLSVLSNELNILNVLANKPDVLRRSLQHIKDIKNFLLKESEIFLQADKIERIYKDIVSDVQTVIASRPDLKAEIDLALYERNLHSLFEIMAVRAEELRQRKDDPLRWGRLPVAEVRHKLIHVLDAIELNAGGRYHIAYDLKDKQPEDYLIEVSVSSVAGAEIDLPLVLLDIMRDLTANARKYTPPGGTIRTHLHDDGEWLTLEVEDSGRGIPERELVEIVHFGQRASNVRDKRTMGGGFGLSKAWYFTHCLQGQMWIRSQEGQGTRVRLQIPAKHLPTGEKSEL